MTRMPAAGDDRAQPDTVLPITLKRTITVGKWLGCAALTAASLYVIYLSVLIMLLSRGLYLRDIIDDAAKNRRGDKVFAETNFEAGETHPWKTVIWLRRAGHLFSTTLLRADSSDIVVGLRWQGDNQLLLQLDLGCDGNHTAPVETVGPVHILYRFGDPGYLPRPGYESFRRRDLPPVPCD
jgi:hypothetical protein